MAKNNIFWIGGAPCCGKSTIAEMLASEFGFKHYKVDNHLDRYLDIGAKKGNKVLKAMKTRSLDEQWLGDIDQLVEDEFTYYRYAQKIIDGDLRRQFGNKKVIVEGAAILPEYIKGKEVDDDRYVCLIPSRTFQYNEFKKRGWIERYLKTTSDPEKAFESWIERDSRFGSIVREKAQEFGQTLIVVDGKKDIDEVYMEVKIALGLAEAVTIEPVDALVEETSDASKETVEAFEVDVVESE